MEIYISDSVSLMYIAMCHFKFMKNKQHCMNVIVLVHSRLD